MVSEVTDLIENIKAASNEQAGVSASQYRSFRTGQDHPAKCLVDESATTSRLMSDHSMNL